MCIRDSTWTSCSFTHAPVTPRRVCDARSTATLMASSELLSESALISVTRATVLMSCPLAVVERDPWWQREPPIVKGQRSRPPRPAPPKVGEQEGCGPTWQLARPGRAVVGWDDKRFQGLLGCVTAGADRDVGLCEERRRRPIPG